MNEYQQALLRIIELEDRNAELLEALEELVAERYNEDWASETGGIVLARIAIRKARGE